MIKVLHILNSYKIGGIEKYVLQLIKEQIQRGEVDVSLYVSNPSGKLEQEFIDLKLEKFTSKKYNNLSHKFLSIKTLKSKFDIIHMHSFRPARDFPILFFTKKIIYTCHSVYGFGRVKKKTDFLKYKMLVYFLNSKKVIPYFNSNYTFEFWKQRNLKKKKIIIYNGVELKKPKLFNLRQTLGVSDKFIIGTTSRLIRWKRIDLLIEAFSKFQKEVKDSILIICGDGDDFNYLNEYVEKLQIKENVIFTGGVVNVEDYQNIMDVCAFPSTTEAFGLVAIECLGLGKPVIAMNDGGGIKEVLEGISPKDIVKDSNGIFERIKYYYESDESNIDDRISFAKNFSMFRCEKEVFKLYS